MEDLDMIWKNKNVLVTGGTGFVGSHLVKRLIQLGANVVTTNLFYSPKSYFFVEKLRDQVEVANLDIVDFEAVKDLIISTQPEYIFHLAAQALVDVAYANPRRTIDSNVMGTVNILESMRLSPGVKGIVVASSDKAYGKSEQKKYHEETALRGDHPYEVSKSAMDLISYSYFKTYGLPVTIARFGNIYGEGDLNDSRIVPGIIKSVINRKALIVRSNGKFVRDYLYVKDVVEGYLLLAENIKQAQGQAYNFGSNDTLSVMEVIKTMETSIDKKIPYKILNTAKNEIPYQSLDYGKVKKDFGWKPKSDFRGMAKIVYEWYCQAWKMSGYSE